MVLTCDWIEQFIRILDKRRKFLDVFLSEVDEFITILECVIDVGRALELRINRLDVFLIVVVAYLCFDTLQIFAQQGAVLQQTTDEASDHTDSRFQSAHDL